MVLFSALISPKESFSSRVASTNINFPFNDKINIVNQDFKKGIKLSMRER